MAARFVVTEAFDLPSRAGLAVAGVMKEGAVGPGSALMDEATGQAWTVLGVDFLRRGDLISVLIARIPGAELPPGTVLVEDSRYPFQQKGDVPNDPAPRR